MKKPTNPNKAALSAAAIRTKNRVRILFSRLLWPKKRQHHAEHHDGCAERHEHLAQHEEPVRPLSLLSPHEVVESPRHEETQESRALRPPRIVVTQHGVRLPRSPTEADVNSADLIAFVQS
jgi:hypothetical protein